MNAGSTGRTLQLFFIDGRPDGMLTAEVFNWTGHVLKVPRIRLPEALTRDNAKSTGVYLLLGEDEERQQAYIGEADNIGKRIGQQETSKEWWDTAVLVTTAGDSLNKAHVRYLEARLIDEAHKAGVAEMKNGTRPPVPGLSEADRANMEEFLSYLLMVLPAIRVDIFQRSTRPESTRERPTERTVSREPSSGEAEFELIKDNLGIRATARIVDGEFVVDAGSIARKEWVGTGAPHYRLLYEELVRTGVLQDQGNQRVFSENYAFRSPSAAATVINGRSSNGTTEWLIKGEGKTYRRWEAEQLKQSTGEMQE